LQKKNETLKNKNETLEEKNESLEEKNESLKDKNTDSCPWDFQSSTTNHTTNFWIPRDLSGISEYHETYLAFLNTTRPTLFFFIRTKFIRTLSLNFGEILRTFLMLKLTRFLIVLKLKYWGSKSCFKQKMHFFVNLSVLFSPKMWQYMVKFTKLNKIVPFFCLSR